MEKLYACSLSVNDECEQIMPIVKKTDEEYKELKNQEYKLKHEKELQEKELKKRVHHLECKENLYDYILAKSIYDNFVDRGLLADSVAFQNNWFEHIFKGKPLNKSLFPEDYIKVLDYIKGGK